MNIMKIKTNLILIKILMVYNFYNFLYNINYKYPLIILKIRIIYSLIIIVFVIVTIIVEILMQLTSFSLSSCIELLLVTDISDFLIQSSNFESDNTNNQLSSSISSSSNQSEPTPPNLPDPINTDLSTALVQNINQDNNSNSNSINSHINGNTHINGNINGNINGHTNLNGNLNDHTNLNEDNSNLNSDESLGFNDVPYDPQEDDLNFNPIVLYHIDHRFFEHMVHFHIANNTIVDVMEAIANSNSEDWDEDSKYDAIGFIAEILEVN